MPVCVCVCVCVCAWLFICYWGLVLIGLQCHITMQPIDGDMRNCNIRVCGCRSSS